MKAIVVDLKQASEITSLSESTLRRRCAEGVFEHFTDGKFLITVASIEAWANSRVQENQPSAA